MQNKFTLSYTVYGGDLEKPVHLKHEFEYDSDLLAALDQGACDALEKAQAKYGEAADILLRGIVQDNAKEWYEYLIKPMNGDKDE
jgi:hypothetical protein